MVISAVVAEYNFFHNGHRFQLDETRAAGADAVVAIMSGSFVQRAEPALLSKFTRARLAAQCGVDLVLELPAPCATASSERFAAGAVAIAGALGCVDMLSFGSECGELAALEEMAAIVTEFAVTERTKELYRQGDHYAKARRMAVAQLYGEQAAALLDGANNLLAVDYIKALRAQQSAIRPFTVRRGGAGHDSEIPADDMASASWLRRQARAGQDISAYVPAVVARAIEGVRAAGEMSGGLAAIDRLALYRLRDMNKGQLAALPDCADGLGHRLYAAAGNARSIDEVYTRAKTRRYTMSRVRRAVLWAVLGLDGRYLVPPPYARILAIGPKGEAILARMKQTARIPFSHDLSVLAASGGDAALLADAEARATDLFALTTDVVGPRGQDYTQKLTKVNDETD